MTVRIKRGQSLRRVRIAKPVSGSAGPKKSLRSFQLGQGLPTVAEMRAEIDEYVCVLLGREDPPIDRGELTLIEYANAVYSRGMELTILLQRAESDGHIAKGSKQYKFRTGELRNFCELAHRAIDLGSRRLTAAKMEYDMTLG